MNNKGFVSTSLIYTFFLIFLSLMVFLLNSYTQNRFLLEEYRYDIKNTIAMENEADINLYLMVWDEDTLEYEVTNDLPSYGYVFEPSYSYCKNGSSLSYMNGNISITAYQKDSCYAYFKEVERDIDLKIYTKETPVSEEVLVKSIPDNTYTLDSYSCNNDAVINFDEVTRKFTIEASNKAECKATFIRRNGDIILHIYKENANGDHEYNNLKYTEVEDIPGSNYTFNSYTCVDESIDTNISVENNELVIASSAPNECNVYYNGGNDKVEVIIMQETDTGISGYTTGKKYSRTFGIPGNNYKYVGYKCDNNNATVTFTNGVIEASSEEQTTCYAYFERTNGNIFYNYYLETSDGGYEKVAVVPSIGYKLDSGMSKCDNGSVINVYNNIPVVDATTEDTCHIYYKLMVSDITVNVYVMNRKTMLYELSKVPVGGYTLYNSGCTNGAVITYQNNSLHVETTGPTVCEVYFK